ncbi:PREDICTED: uncharacterized protein LOC106818880 [Priapulus caudatus]|uniref:Uncharacterized protein LOC106818880 n=1 Tax=Priapulus caudatus TaxID=37621 RepID=A0ABM1F3L4_PRICU|nr:PREDICTED: uncharacterized protein LOC106818880 [Priapulus caudatus]
MASTPRIIVTRCSSNELPASSRCRHSTHDAVRFHDNDIVSATGICPRRNNVEIAGHRDDGEMARHRDNGEMACRHDNVKIAHRHDNGEITRQRDDGKIKNFCVNGEMARRRDDGKMKSFRDDDEAACLSSEAELLSELERDGGSLFTPRSRRNVTNLPGLSRVDGFLQEDTNTCRVRCGGDGGSGNGTTEPGKCVNQGRVPEVTDRAKTRKHSPKKGKRAAKPRCLPDTGHPEASSVHLTQPLDVRGRHGRRGGSPQVSRYVSRRGGGGGHDTRRVELLRSAHRRTARFVVGSSESEDSSSRGPPPHRWRCRPISFVDEAAAAAARGDERVLPPGYVSDASTVMPTSLSDASEPSSDACSSDAETAAPPGGAGDRLVYYLRVRDRASTTIGGVVRT